jgi:ferrous iron transport protein A
MVSLTALNTGQVGFIHALRGGHRLKARLAALGFTLGAPVTVNRNYGYGPIIVSVRGAQVALGRGEAGHILVYSAEDSNASLTED